MSWRRLVYPVAGFALSVAAPFLMLKLADLLSYRSDLLRACGDHIYLLYFLAPLCLGWGWGRLSPLPATFFSRFFPLALPPLLFTVAYMPVFLLGFPILAYMPFDKTVVIFGGAYACLWIGMLAASERRARSVGKLRGAVAILALFAAGGLLSVALYKWDQRDLLDGLRLELSAGHGVHTYSYHPFASDTPNELKKLDFTPSLRIDAGYPRLDGAIAAYPLYAAFVQAVYVGLDHQTVHDYVKCSNTVEAYERLAVGQADVFFGVAPSDAQRALMESKGLTVVETPIGKEAFVFFAHKDNPVRSLTREEVVDIYSGRIRNWKEVGGADMPILAFQRPENSGSQTAMLRLMGDRAMLRPLKEEVSKNMADIVRQVADYRNSANALGYSFRFYATTLYPNPDIRLLAVDGVEPTPENIANSSYPFTVSLLAVTARPLSSESRSLLDWILGPEGQDLLEKVGYVPLR